MEDLYITEAPKVKCDIVPKNKLIKHFYDTLKQNKFDTNYLCKNASTVKIKMIDEMTGDMQGGYSTFRNVILLKKNKNYMDYITHELFHMSSTIRDNDKIYTGFFQKNKDFGIGIGLNEGYTQLLDERYFSDLTPTKRANDTMIYPVSKKIAGWVEELVGKEVMEDMYIHANLDGLTMELCKYADGDKVLEFLSNMDTYYFEAEDKVHGNLFKALKAFDNCLLFILECGYYKLYNMYMNNELTSDDYIEYLKGLQKLQRQRLHVGLYGILKSVPLGDEYYNTLTNKVKSRLL